MLFYVASYKFINEKRQRTSIDIIRCRPNELCGEQQQFVRGGKNNKRSMQERMKLYEYLKLNYDRGFTSRFLSQ